VIGKVLVGGMAVVLVVPTVAVLAAFGVAGQTDRCIGDALNTTATAGTDAANGANDPISGAQPENPNPVLASTALPPTAAMAPRSTATATPLAPASGCAPGLGTESVVVPPGTPVDVTAAVRNALAYVGVRNGWYQLCDRLACRAYGYVGSGYVSAKAHWQVMLAHGYAHPGDRCPPLGSFVFFDTGRPFGHVSIVVKADPVACDPNVIEVTSNEVFDAATGGHGGVYLLSLARLDHMELGGHGYLGWSDPICAGAPLPAGTIHPVPSGM
jgi:hypothetical protein